jgi:hypothetical protein
MSDFDRYVAEHTGGPVPRFEKVEPGDEQVLDDLETAGVRRGPVQARPRRLGRSPAASDPALDGKPVPHDSNSKTVPAWPSTRKESRLEASMGVRGRI